LLSIYIYTASKILPWVGVGPGEEEQVSKEILMFNRSWEQVIIVMI
jgi:hypothetical protein